MPTRRLPSKPSLDHLKYQAKDLLQGHADCNARAAQRIREFHPRFRNAADTEVFNAEFKLSDAQFAIAREHGFPSWTKLRLHIEEPTASDRLDLPHHERIADAVFRRAVELLDTGDVSGLCSLLKQHPGLTHRHVAFPGGNYFRNPTLLEFIAENPIRHGKLPPNIVEIAKVILATGVDPPSLNEALELVATGRVPRECNVQIPLIDLLCDHGADANGALQGAASHGEFEAVDALLRCGARINLPIAAALGQMPECHRVFPLASREDRHRALALASQCGHVDAVKLLLDAGEDPNRYNPIGSHSHSTPLHQAALAGHHHVVRLLVERGAKVDLEDVLWHGTPADWANHAGHTEIEDYLRLHHTSGDKPK